MYIDPNVGGMLFQALAVAFAFITGIVLVFSSKIRAGIARFRRFFRKENGETEEKNSR